MSLLEHPQAQALLDDAEVSAADVRGCQHRLQRFLQRLEHLSSVLRFLHVDEVDDDDAA